LRSKRECPGVQHPSVKDACYKRGILERERYTQKELEKFTAGDRSMSKKMKRKFKKLSDDDKETLIHYYAGKN